MPSQTWDGGSGSQYTYEVYAVPMSPNPVAANYIFARFENNSWFPLYIGETSNLAVRLEGHEKWPCATARGVTHIHAHVSSTNAQERRPEEADLIARWSPPCND